MSHLDLRADCARCAALCCVAFHHDRSDQFGADKVAGEPCTHLDAAGACGIHGCRADQGFRGCVGYDCYGAGQRVTQVLFDGRSWLDDRTLLSPMVEAFLVTERAHRLLLVLRVAAMLDLSPEDRGRLDGLALAIERAGARAETIFRLETEARRFLGALRGYVAERLRGEGDCAAARLRDEKTPEC